MRTSVGWAFVSYSKLNDHSSRSIHHNINFYAVETPLEPSLSLSSISATSANLEWTQDLTQPVTMYILRWTYTGPCAPLPPQSEVISGAARSLSITGLEEGGSYRFGLTAFNGEGTSPENITTGQTLPTGTNDILLYRYWKGNVANENNIFHF